MEKKMEWNKAQQQAIETRKKNILVSAAAGSGKTAVLVERIRQLILQDGEDIGQMLIVTFTNAAAAEMRERIYGAIAQAAENWSEKEEAVETQRFLREQMNKIGSANISTFHSFCMEVIRRYFYLTETPPDFAICDEIQKSIFQSAAMDTLLEEAFEWPEEYGFQDFARRFARAGNEKEIRTMVDETHRFIQSLPDPFGWLREKTAEMEQSQDPLERKLYADALVLERLVTRYEQLYREQKSRKHLLDFNDIEHIALGILDFEQPRKEYQEQFRYIFVDEYQDSNVVQEALIEKIRRPDNVFMVGDVKQSIYKFRLAEPELFLKKYEAYKKGDDPNSVKIDLNQNFRSKKNVIECVNQVFSHIMKKEVCGMDYDEDARLYQGKATEFDIEAPACLYVVDESQADKDLESDVAEMKKTELEAAACARIIKEIIGEAYYDWKKQERKIFSYRDIVILLRGFKTSAELYQEVLQQSGIPVYADGGDGYFDTLEVQVFTNLLKVIDNTRQDIPMLSILRSVIGGFSLEEIGRIRAFQPQGLFSEAFLAYCSHGESEERKKDPLYEKARCFLEKLSRWRLLEKQMPLRAFLWHLAEESMYYEYVGALPHGSQRKANLRLLIEKAEQYQTAAFQGLFGYIQYLDNMRQTKTPMGEMKLLGEQDDVVRIMTIHKSKGLEFPAVIVGGMGKRFNRSKPSAALSFDRELGMGMRYRDPEMGYYIKTSRQRQIDEKKKEGELAEEMRILYVALTRAKDRLVLLGTNKGSLSEIREKFPETEKGKSYFDWVLPPLLQMAEERPDQMQVREWSRMDIAQVCGGEKKEEVLSEGMRYGFKMESALEKQIQERVFRRMSFRYPFPAAAKTASKFTVSEISRLRGEDPEQPDADRIPEMERDLIKPDSTETLTAAERGTITHFVLQRISLPEILRKAEEGGEEAGLSELGMQIGNMVEKELLEPAQAEAVDRNSLLGFVYSSLGRRTAAAAEKGMLYREQSFNFMEDAALWLETPDQKEAEALLKEGGSIIIQGMIDCFFREDDGYVLLDYKTDHIIRKGQREEEKQTILKEKKKYYETQIRLYRRAIEAAMGKPVKEAYLYFLDSGDAVPML